MPIRKTRKKHSHHNHILIKIKGVTSESATTLPTDSNEPVIKPVDDWKVTIDGENVTLPDTGDS